MVAKQTQQGPASTTARQGGFSTLEILMASAILVIVFSAVILLVLGGQKIAADTEAAHEAQLIARKYLEEGRIGAITNFSIDRDYTGTMNSDDLIYTINREDVSSRCFKTITVDVDWSVEGRALNVSFSTQVANPQEAFAIGGSCPTSEPPGENPWQSCTSDLSAEIQPSGSQATDLDVFSLNGTGYLTVISQHSGGGPDEDTAHDLWIYQVNASGFSFVSSLDLVMKEGLSAVTAARSGAIGPWYIYAAKNSGPQIDDKNQLRIISLADINAPVQVGQLLFTGNNEAKDILYYNGFVYLAIGNNVYKINISNPASPIVSSTVNLNATVNKLSAQGNFLYAATADNNGELKVINTATMATVGAGFNAQGNEDGTSVFVLGNTVYLGRERSQNNPDLYVLNMTTPASPQVLGSKNLGHTAQSYIVDILVNGNLAFIGSTKEEFEVWNVENPQNIFIQCSPDNSVAQVAAGLDELNNVIYGAIRSNDAVRRYIDTNNPPQ